MCVRSIKNFFLFFFLIAFSATSANAKKRDFVYDGMFHLAFSGGVSGIPTNTFLTENIDSASSFSPNYGFALVLDFKNFILEPGIDVISYPLLTGRGFDSTAASNFRQSIDASTTIYGLKLKLVPFIFAQRRARVYIGGSGGIASTSTKNQRDYLNASGTITSSNQERSSSTGQSIDFFVGSEFFVVQNWSLGLNLGYRIMKFDTFEYEGTTNVRGQTVNQGAEVLNNQGAVAGLNATSGYANLQIIVHF